MNKQVEGSWSTGSLFLRDLSMTVHHDFDHMTDIFRLRSRSAPWSALKRSGFTFEKRILDVVLPPRGTTERDGADMVIGVLSEFLPSHDDQHE